MKKGIFFFVLFVFYSAVSFADVIKSETSSVSSHYINRIEVYPSFLSLYRGDSVWMDINCFDIYGYSVPDFTLRYFMTDIWGRVVPYNFVHIDPPGILRVFSWATPGRYLLHFEDVYGPAQTFIYLDIC